MKKNLVYYFYASKDFANDLSIREHLYYINRYSNIFDKSLFTIAVDDLDDNETISKAMIAIKQNYFGDKNGLSFKIIQNDPKMREVVTFKNDLLDKLKDFDGIVLFGHTKGTTNFKTFKKEPIMNWIAAMWFYSCEHIDDVEQKLSESILYGPTLHDDNNKHKLNFNKYNCWYCGTFYWINPKKFLERFGNEEFKVKDRWFAEKLPGNLLKVEELRSYNDKKILAEKFNIYTGDWSKVIVSFGDSEKYFEVFNNMVENVNEKLGSDDFTFNSLPKIKDDLQMYVLSLKDYVYLYKDDFHKQLQLGTAFVEKPVLELSDNVGDNISNRNHIYSETTGVYWIWKNALNTKYVGHENHRRHFNLTKEKMIELLKEYDIILPKKSEFKINMELYYKVMHNFDDLEMCETVLKELYPEYSDTYDNVIKKGKTLYCSDCYATTRENYDKINSFIFSILFEVENRLGLHNDEEWMEHVISCGNKVIPREHTRNGMSYIQYQMLACGFLYERLLTIFIEHNFNKIYETEMEMLEEEYNKENMKIMLCCIGRMENAYIREYVEFYKSIGVTKICLFDNNRDGEENFEDVIGDYIESGYVILKNYRNITTPVQLKAYNECYEEYKNDYDWFLFFDIDEFMFFNSENKNNKMNEFLAQKKFNGFDMIHLNWLCYGDCGNVHYSDRPVIERFPTFLPLNLKTTYDFPDNHHIKSIVRGGLNDVIWDKTSHTPTIGGICCGPNGTKIASDSPFNPYDFREAGIRHYTTKSTEEFANKVNRGFCDGNNINKKAMIELYFKRNEITKEKVDLFNEMCGVDVSYLLPSETEKDVQKRDDVKIYSLCYSKKDFDFLNDAVVTPLQVGAFENSENVCKLKDTEGESISAYNYFFVEGTGTYWIWKNVKDAKYKGQMQYRRPLEGINENFDFEKVFENYDVITCEPFNHPANKRENSKTEMFIEADTVEQGYAFSNCADDLSILEIVISIYLPEYKEDYVKYIKNGENLYYSNGFIMKSEDFDRYSEFLFKCLWGYMNMTNIHTKKDLYDHVRYNIETGKYPRYNHGEPVTEQGFLWQTRIGGFLSERIWTLWLLHNFSEDRIYKLPYIKMEENMYT